MKQIISKTIQYDVYDDLCELSKDRYDLVLAADKASQLAYAPYSDFYVGAAVLLEDGSAC